MKIIQPDHLDFKPNVGKGHKLSLGALMIFIPNAGVLCLTEYPNSQVYQIASPPVHIQYSGDGISIIDANDAEIAVCDTDGTLYFETLHYKNETIAIPKGKTYIVSINGDSIKVVF